MKDGSGTEYTGDQNLANYSHYYSSESYLINPDSENMEEKYGELNDSGHYIVTLKNRPTMICYDKDVYSAWSKLEAVKYSKADDNTDAGGQPGYRMDGRWYYSKSDQMVKSHVLIEYRESKLDSYTCDYYQPNTIDYTQDGYDKTKNLGLSTGIRAYFTNTGIVSNADNTYTNSSGSTEAAAITDGEQTFDLVTSPDLDGAYTFEGWYLLNNGKYTFVSDDYEYSAEALTNDVYVARYIKVPSGIVNITHSLTSDSTGVASTKLQVSVVNYSNNTVGSDVFAFEETTGGQIVNAVYIKKDTSSPKALKITLKNTPGAFTSFNEFKEKITGTLQTLAAGGKIASVTFSTSGDDHLAVVIVPINDLFDSNGDQTTKALPFFSKVSQNTYTYDIQYSYTSRYWDVQTYNSKGTFAIEELATYVDSSTMAFKSGKKAEFLAAKSPYEDNFKETVKWNFDGAAVPTYDSVNRKYTGSVSAVQTADKSIDIKFVFPFAYNNETIKTINPETGQPYGLVPEQSADDDNKILMIDTEESIAFTDTMTYLDWYSLNDCKNAADKADEGKPNEPFLLEAPDKIYVKNTVTEGEDPTYTEYTFQYWTLSTYPTATATSVEYKKCYSRFFNLALYQSTVATPFYKVVTQEDPQVQPATGNIATINFLENSRNQWNYGGGNKVEDIKPTWKEHGDRLFSDFVISFEYEGKTLKDEDKTKYQAGILLETVDDLTPNDDGEVVTLSNEDYKAIYEAEEGSLTTAKSNATTQIESHHGDIATEYKITRDGKQISYLFAGVADIKNLDDKNSIEYAYSFANISQSGTSENPTPTVRKNKVYRAFSYLYADGTIIISDPIYFTIYDMASISTGEAYIAPANNG